MRSNSKTAKQWNREAYEMISQMFNKCLHLVV